MHEASPRPAPQAPSSPRTAAAPADALAAHEFAVRASGFSIIEDFVDPGTVAELADAADRAAAMTRRRISEGATFPPHVFDHDFYFGARSLFLWGDACVRLLEHETIRHLTDAIVGPHKVLEMLLLSSLPAANLSWEITEGWHRDVEPVPGRPRYLWYMLPLDDFRADNGSTWIVPGSHRLPESEVTAPSVGPHRFPSRVQIIAKAGDALVLDPTTLHSRGHNASDRPRRMLNLMLCHETTPLLNNNHWEYAGRQLRAVASPRVRAMLGGSPSPEAEAAAALGQQTAMEKRGGARTPAWPALPDDLEA